jgi:predicted nuclease of restriction endonuclease-like (RecB) superfamily
MPSDAERFESDFRSFKEFVDDEGRHFYVIQFEDDSGRILRKRNSDDGDSMAEFVIRDGFAMEGMRKIASATDFEVDEESNTQQNLRNLMGEL